jgi:hypothetical protein
MSRAISAASARGAPGRTSCKRQVSGARSAHSLQMRRRISTLAADDTAGYHRLAGAGHARYSYREALRAQKAQNSRFGSASRRRRSARRLGAPRRRPGPRPAARGRVRPRQSLEIYSRSSLADAQQRYDDFIGDFPSDQRHHARLRLGQVSYRHPNLRASARA